MDLEVSSFIDVAPMLAVSSKDEPYSVLLIAPVPIDFQMSGPGIRYWEFARVLSQQQPVTLLTPSETTLTHERFAMTSCTDSDVLPQLLAEHAIVVLQGFTLFHRPEILPILKENNNYIAVDVYTPLNLEGLELHPDTSENAVDWNLVDLNVLREQFKVGDFFFCASERQRDYWLGMLSALGRINPHVYWDDQTGRRLIDVVPFGLPAAPPVYQRPVLKGVHPKIAPMDKVLLWFGGLWNWLDPLTVIRAFKRVVTERPEARLVFVTRMPADLSDPASAIAAQTVALSKELGLHEDKVLFCESTPFNERESLLLEADGGLCYHPGHLEARFSFRTRLLDYLWAGLPVITGAGDVLGELIEAEGLGYAVPPDDVDSMCAAMVALLDEPDARGVRKEAFARVRRRFTWEAVVTPLANFCQNPWHAADWGVDAYAPYKSSDWESLICSNVHHKHWVTALRHQLQEQDAVIQERDALIQDIMNGRVMRLMTGIQEHLCRLPWFGAAQKSEGDTPRRTER